MLLLMTLVNNIVFNCLVEHFLCIGFDHCHIYWLLQSVLFYSLYAEVALIAIYSMPGEMCVIFNHHIIFSFVNRNLISKVTYFCFAIDQQLEKIAGNIASAMWYRISQQHGGLLPGKTSAGIYF